MGQNLTGQLISATYEDLVQISGSRLTDGTGSNINNLTVTASNATNAVTASFLLGSVASASYVATAVLTGSVAQNTLTFTKFDGSTFNLTVSTGSAANTGSLLVTASISNATTTYTKGDGSTFSLVTNNVSNASTASIATSASFATNASTATSASFATTASFALNVTPINTGSFVTTASVSNATTTFTKGDSSTFTTTVNNVSNASTASIATSASFATNAATATSASFASTIANGLNINANTVTASAATFTNLTAVSASFGYVRTTTGSAVIIGDEFIILNADTPTAPFAGIKVYDTGSASTASIEWNGNTDTWITVEENGASAMILTGISGSKGSEVAPALNKLLKGTGNNTVADSSITDNGTNVSFTTPIAGTQISASTGFLGNLIGTASFATTASFALNSLPAFPFTGSAQITGSLGVTGSINVSSGSFSGSVIDNIGDVYTSTPAVNHVVTLTQAEYNAISIPDTDTFYIITDGGGVSTSIFATTGSNTFIGNQIVSGSVTVTGSLTVTGSVNMPTITGSLLGTASFATTATSASFATTASFALNAGLVPGSSPNSIKSAPFLTATPATSSGTSSIALGNNAISYANYSVIIGDGAHNYDNSRENVVYIGRNASGAQNSIAIGYGASSLSDSSVVIGRNAAGNANNNVTIGYNANASDGGASTEGGIAIGRNTQTRHTDEVNLGNRFRFNSGSLGFIQLSGSILNPVVTGSLTITGSNSTSLNPILKWARADGYENGILTTNTNGAAVYSNRGNSILYLGVNQSGQQEMITLGSAGGVGFFGLAGGSTPFSFYSTVAVFNRPLTISGSLTVTGSVRGQVSALTIASNTASLDCSLDNFFTLQLVSGSNTFINPSNILPGQTINLRVNTTGSATVSFPSSVKQVTGSSYVPTTTTGTDIVTFISFDNTSLFLSNVKNLA